MKVALTSESLRLLQSTALHSPAVVELRGGHETALAMRVDETFSYRRSLQPFVLNCIGYQAKEGIWVVALAFQLGTQPDRQVSGCVYLNPFRSMEYAMIQHLAIQERFLFVFLNSELGGVVTQERTWGTEERYRIRQLLSQIDRSAPSLDADSEHDAEFERVKAAFHARFPLSRLLAAQTPVGGVAPSFFRGAVLE